MKEFEVEVKFIDGTEVIVKVEAEDERDAMDKAMPTSVYVK